MNNKTTKIISYKHDGSLHRIWEYVTVLRETDDYILLINNMSYVIDGNGRRWKTKEPALCYFYKHNWFNIIAVIRNKSIFYYCNLSSPFVLDSEGIKYIDYDLDVKVLPDNNILILDRDEFEFNKNELQYPEDIVNIIEEELKHLLALIKEKVDPFNLDAIFNDYKLSMKD